MNGSRDQRLQLPVRISPSNLRFDMNRPIDPVQVSGRAILDRAPVHVTDVLEDPEYRHDVALAGGWRAMVSVPMLRDGLPVSHHGQ